MSLTADVRTVSRPWQGLEDIPLLQRHIREQWRAEKPLFPLHVGDVPWWILQHEKPPGEWERRIHLWFEERGGDGPGELVAWSFLNPPDSLDTFLRADLRGGPIQEEMLDRFEAQVADARAAGTNVPRTDVWELETHDTAIRLLSSRGYLAADEEWMNHNVLILDTAIPEPVLPPGYEVRAVRGPEDLEARVEVHRQAFAPSRVTTASYGRLMQDATYRPDLDHVVVAPDGTFAAFCLAWFDAEGKVGEFEPVGTHPGHRRLGLARAACLAALRSLAALGTETVLVFSDGQDVGANALYQGMGFRPLTRVRRFSRTIDVDAAPPRDADGRAAAAQMPD